ncbi:MAG TPA: substrate-binding domain-containing protein [Mycobacteriales bacterium]|nr:substrate-binding domain-containing protein [Mycobacteriales bacterium]
MTKKRAYVAALAGVAIAAAACGSSSSGGNTAASTPPAASSAPAASSSAPAAPSISANSFTRDFSAMAALKSLAAQGKGSVGVILPDTTSSARWAEFDAPYLTQAFEAAGLSASQISVKNAQGSDSTFVTDAEADITNGASVLLTDPEDPGTGGRVATYAAQHGVKVIDYDRITQGAYYISFNNVQVGKLIGQGFASCVAKWKVAKPDLIKMVGAPTDNNATQFAKGYDGVISAHPSWKVAASPPGTWTPSVALTEFEQAFTANPGVNSAVIPNDENAAPIITYLKNHGIKPNTFPITGQDATLIGFQNMLTGYQCGTAYKPIYLEAQAAAAVAMYVRAGQTPPSSLVNATTANPNNGNKAMPSVLLTPEWVTPSTIASTVIKDQFVTAKQLCTAAYKAACSANGISG